MRLSTPSLIALALVLSITVSPTQFEKRPLYVVTILGDTYLRLENGTLGTLIIRENGSRVVRFPDGTHRRENGDKNGGSMRIAARELRARVSVPYEPRICDRTMRSVESAQEALATSDDTKRAKNERRLEKAQDRYKREGTAKAQCMTANKPYDPLNLEVKKGEHPFEKRGEARRRYGTAVPMYAV